MSDKKTSFRQVLTASLRERGYPLIDSFICPLCGELAVGKRAGMFWIPPDWWGPKRLGPFGPFRERLCRNCTATSFKLYGETDTEKFQEHMAAVLKEVESRYCGVCSTCLPLRDCCRYAGIWMCQPCLTAIRIVGPNFRFDRVNRKLILRLPHSVSDMTLELLGVEIEVEKADEQRY